MAEKVPQTYENHVRMDPWYHYVLFLMQVAGLALAVYLLIRDLVIPTIWMVLIQLTLFLTTLKTRTYALKVQDRVIRLEERLRLERLLSEPLRSRIMDVDESQLIALRFASDAEVAGLVEQVLAKKLAPKEIKQAIRTWRPDYFRV